MKTLSWWAIASGLAFCALTFAVMPYLEWYTTKMLSQYDGQKFVPEMMELMEEDFRIPLAITRAHSCFSVVAGILMLKHRRAGWLLWITLCALSIATSIYDYGRGVAVTAAIFRGIWWTVVLWVSWTTVQTKARGYWKAPAAPSL